ncbi:MAG TPA: hypothetical protein VGL12_10335 [Roseiarcus sp.]
MIDEATGAPRSLTIDELVARVSRLDLKRRDEAARLIREDRDGKLARADEDLRGSK